MKAVIQRVSSACVKINNQAISNIKKGLVILLGISEADTKKDIDIIVDKIKNLRIFEDLQGKMNSSLQDINGELLVVSQFTLLADLSKGRRPSFSQAAAPEKAENIYKQVIAGFKKCDIKVETGEFGQDMQVELINDGPVTLIFDTNRENI
ncbi:MAG: D-aminoacyl-tRNA deacylase [Candidatus Omnitrophica bacterium]|nr:D-aminoacyl-tRNA deacylase [Candidatus Omnitrophota bacterium]MDD5351916.1 D-aminoacyl-tRNA deacylase [Candidatus Omnitrophota bacterium]MDD5550742.1 D-aminoacyl-tRNA deacylase [Candidatus Omnitrophota bacterium]